MPDQRIWDKKTFADLPVASIAFGEIPLAAAAHTVESGKLIQVGFDEEFPPTRSQVDELLEKLDVVAEGIIKAILLAALGIGALILLLRFFK